MQKPHIHLIDRQQEIKITILERNEGQPYGTDDNDFLPVKIEYTSKKVSFIKELIYFDTYEMLCFYCSLDNISIGNIKKQGFSFFVEPDIDFLLENIDGKILFTIFYKENEENKDRIELKQVFTKQQFNELIKKVHQGCSLWFDDSDIIEFREYLDSIEDGYYDEVLPRHRVAEVEFKNSGKLYCYLCKDESIKKGDLVVVPTFFDKETIAEIIGIEYFEEDDLPCSLDKMKKVIKKYVKPLSDKIGVHSYDITEGGFGFGLLVNFVFQKDGNSEFSIKDKNAYYNVYLKEYRDIYLDSYREMLMLKPNEMKITKGLWLTAEKVLHIGFVDKKKNFSMFFNNILDKAKKLNIRWVGIPCILEKYNGIRETTFFKTALKATKKWILENNKYEIEILFCCPNKRLYKKFKKIYDKKIKANN